MASPLQGEGFINSWNGRSVYDLVVRINTTMPADDPGSLSTATCRDIVTYLLQANRFPAGASELPSEGAVLKTIAIRPTEQ